MGKLIVIDGVDASGKETQAKLTAKRLGDMGYNVKVVSFPCYGEPWSYPVRMYLEGEFGKNAEDVSPYTASMLFAVDRFASYMTDWKKNYESDDIIICDRYVSSNMIHQASKIDGEAEKLKFLKWIDDLEFNKNKLPRPDVTLFLDMPTEYGAKLMAQRKNKIDGSDVHDIHESNYEYLKKSYDNAVFAADTFGWKRICCVREGEIRAIDDINDEILTLAEVIK